MSLITKIFIVLTAIMAVVFMIIAGSLLAKQSNFKVRANAERINRIHEEEISKRLHSRYDSLQERKRKTIFKSRENMLYAYTVIAQLEAKYAVAKKAAEDVDLSIDRFADIRSQFDKVVEDYSAMLENIMSTVTQVSENKNKIGEKRSTLWKNLTSIEAKVGHLREEINLFDYNLYRMRKNNRAKRQTLEIYREIDPDSYIPGLEQAPKLKDAHVISYDPDTGLVGINHGYSSHVEKHQVFTLSRNSEFVAKIEIINIQAGSAVGRIIEGTTIRQVKLGDSVKPAAYIK
ncbi:MAG: hypothetical protein K8S87_09605 [Planctomycetes bacterium]|nr:hypothetical protein [Planctomycetota bacterium]